MKIRKSRKYKTYGPIPQNEYSSDASKVRISPAILADKPADTAYKQRLVKRQAQHSSGWRRISGWARSWKANGWRAESAVMHDEARDMGRYSTYV